MLQFGRAVAREVLLLQAAVLPEDVEVEGLPQPGGDAEVNDVHAGGGGGSGHRNVVALYVVVHESLAVHRHQALRHAHHHLEEGVHRAPAPVEGAEALARVLHDGDGIVRTQGQ